MKIGLSTIRAKDFYYTKAKTKRFFQPDEKIARWVKDRTQFLFNGYDWFKLEQSVLVGLFSIDNEKYDKNPFHQCCQKVTSKRSIANLNRFHKEKIKNHFENLKIEIK
jgi:hypothetical protein